MNEAEAIELKVYRMDVDFWATACKTVRPMLSDRCLSALSCLSVCLSVLSVTLVCCGQTVRWIKVKLGVHVGLGPDHIVLDEDQLRSLKRGTAVHFSPHVYCGQTAGWIKMPHGTEVGLSPINIVFDADLDQSPQGTEPPNFQPMFVVATKRLDGSRCHLVRR